MDFGRKRGHTWMGVRLFTQIVVLCDIATLACAQNKELTYTVYEEEPVPSVVGNLSRDSNVSQLLGHHELANLRYRLLPQPDQQRALFTVHNSSGLLLTSSRLDREALCHFSQRCRLQVYVAIQQTTGSYFVTVKVTINLRDINDNAPHFPQTSMAMSVPENSWTDGLEILPAMDRDIGLNSVQRYVLLTGASDIFRLQVTPSLDGSLLPSLHISSRLDREQTDFYQLMVQAEDGGSPVRSATLTLNITVEDVNDNPPAFTASQYDVSVNETLPVGSVIMIVSASDPDIGVNGQVRYRLSARQTDDNANAFSVQERTGEVRSEQSLTSLQGLNLHIVIQAVDRGAKALQAQTLVKVTVLDLVNNPPLIRLNTISGDNVSLVPENAPAGYVVAHLLVLDTDSGPNGIVSCSVVGGSFALQRLSDKEYKVTLIAALNREQKDRHDITVRCWDLGSPSSLRTSAQFRVVVQDVNDNAPVFSRQLYQRKIREGQGSGVVLTVDAVDADLGENGRVTYRLGNASSFLTSLIQVREHSGDVVVLGSLDRERHQLLDLFVVAEDHGEPQNTATARVVLHILDINDCKPTVPPGYSLSVSENQPVGVMVGVIRAVDEDEGDNGKISYHLLSDHNATHFFSLERTGAVRSRAVFDREAKDTYRLSVLASDLGQPPNTNILSVAVKITDQNDHAPHFLCPNDTMYQVNITMETLARSFIFRAKVKDADIGVNGRVDFGLASDNYGIFSVSRSSGVVSTMRNLEARDAGTYSLVLLARDRGDKGGRSASATLLVSVGQGGTQAALSKTPQHLVIIVVVLVGLAVFISAGVIAVILRLRHRDRQEERLSSSAAKTAYHLRPLRSSASLNSLSGSKKGMGLGGSSWNSVREKGRYGGWKHVVQETQHTAQPEDDLLLYKLKLAQQYKHSDPKNSKSVPLVKPQNDKLLTTGHQDTATTDSNRSCHQRQTKEMADSQTESGFASFLAEPLKEGWRHMELKDQHTGLRSARYWRSTDRFVPTQCGPQWSSDRTTDHGGLSQLADQRSTRSVPGQCADQKLSDSGLDDVMGKTGHQYGSASTDCSPKRYPACNTRTVVTAGPRSPCELKSTSVETVLQSSRPGAKLSDSTTSIGEYVDIGRVSKCGETLATRLSPVGASPDQCQDDPSATVEWLPDTMNDDDGNTTTSGSYTLDLEQAVQELQSDIFL